MPNARCIDTPVASTVINGFLSNREEVIPTSNNKIGNPNECDDINNNAAAIESNNIFFAFILLIKYSTINADANKIMPAIRLIIK